MSTAPATSIYKPGQLYQVPPGTLVLERNIRAAKPDADLLASVKQLGVMQPVTAVIGADGRLLVRLGERRTLAAIEAKQPTVPVYVAGVDDTDTAAEILRIISQRDENTVRAGLTDAEDLGVVEQLAAFGLSHDEIVSQARIARDRVETATVVGASKLAKGAIARYEALTLDQAATIADFDDDTETAKALIVTAVENPEQFAHAAQRARDERIRERHATKLRAQLEKAGVRVIERPGYSDKPKALTRLSDTKGKTLTAAAHKACAGHVAWLDSNWGWVDDDGNVVPSGKGSRQMSLPELVYGCKDPEKQGHRAPSNFGSGKTAAADLSPDEREAAKKARRLIIENNKAWDSATPVRREYIATLAKLKTPPKGTAAFIAGALSFDRYILTHEGNQTVRETLCAEWGLPMVSAGYGKRVDVPKTTTEARALVIALVQVLAAHESSIDRMDWRRDGTTGRHGRYLRFLESTGYQLSDVEKYAVSSKRPDKS